MVFKQNKNNAICSSPNLGMGWVWISRAKRLGILSPRRIVQVMTAAPYECCGVPVGFQWGSCGALWGSQVLAENVQGFVRDSYGAFKISKRPLQKQSRSHLMILPVDLW